MSTPPPPPPPPLPPTGQNVLLQIVNISRYKNFCAKKFQSKTCVVWAIHKNVSRNTSTEHA